MPTLILAPGSDNVQLGFDFAVAGDIDGDGVPDLAVSDPSYRAGGLFSSGIVYLISGADGSLLRSYGGTPAASQLFGRSLAALDANGDGIPDLAVGAPGHAAGAGAVTIYSGADGSVLSVVVGPAASQYGSALANAGDQNEDGIDDLFVGAPNLSSKGAVFVQSGSDGTGIRAFHPGNSFSLFGSTVAATGDIDGDGLADLAVGAPNFSSQKGRISIIRSSDEGIAAQLAGIENFNRLGESLAPVADVDGDGFPDLLVGSFSGGIALVLSGKDLSVLSDLSIPELPAFRQVQAGGSLDFDGDGIDDWLIGSTAMNLSAATPAGGIRIISGADGSTLFEHLTEVAMTGLGLGPKALPGYGFAAGERSLTDPVTGGKGFAYFWRVVSVDSDGDGIPDDEDAVPHSIMDPTVILSGIDSGVENRVDETGTTLADRFAVLGQAADYRQPAHFIPAANSLARGMEKVGLLTKKERQQLTQSAVEAAKAGRR